MAILTPEQRREIREGVYSFSEATPVDGLEERIDEVQIKTAELQANESLEQVIDLLKKHYVRGKDSAVLVKDIRKLNSKEARK